MVFRVLAAVFGGLLLALGLALVGYNVYWLLSRSGMAGEGWLGGLGAGFALFFVMVGLVLAAVGGVLVRIGRRR